MVSDAPDGMNPCGFDAAPARPSTATERGFATARAITRSLLRRRRLLVLGGLVVLAAGLGALRAAAVHAVQRARLQFLRMAFDRLGLGRVGADGDAVVGAGRADGSECAAGQ